MSKAIPDIVDYNLEILFCGINPGLFSAKTGHHFARPGNRFWKALFLGGLTPTIYHPTKDKDLLNLGLGIINFVDRASGKADELSKNELQKGAKKIIKKVKKYQPKALVFLGLGAYRIAFKNPKAKIGLQEEKIGHTKIWVLPNPSGLNAHFKIDDFGKMFKSLKEKTKKP